MPVASLVLDPAINTTVRRACLGVLASEFIARIICVKVVFL